MKNWGYKAVFATVLLLGLAGAAAAQDSSTKDAKQDTTSSSTATAEDEVSWGQYKTTGTFEFGGHVVDESGNQAMWSTLVNKYSGPRLLDQFMQVDAPRGGLFDHMDFSSFGFGGDPNSVGTFHIMKTNWYQFSAKVRNDRNFWDYDLFANPLNPTTGSNPTVLVLQSPHTFATVRRFADYGLTLFPKHTVSVRLGYSTNRSEGPAFSTIHEGTEGLLLQNWRNILHTWSGGVDIRLAPRITLSLDSSYGFYKGDTTATLAAAFPATLANGNPVDLGLPFNTAAGQPCAAPLLPSGKANPACNGYFSTDRSNPTRNHYPTGQVTLQSSFVKNLDVVARVNYTGASSDSAGFLETFSGLSTRTREAQYLLTGDPSSERIAVSSDFGVTYRMNEHIRLNDEFRWVDFRNPGGVTLTDASLFASTLTATPNGFNPATCPAVPATCPNHSASSGPDMFVDLYDTFLSQDTKTNTIEAEFEINSHVGGRAGYRRQNRFIRDRGFTNLDQVFFPSLPNRGACAGQSLKPDGSCEVITPTVDDGDSIEINSNTGLFGVWLKPVRMWRVNFDAEIMSADNVFTRVSPRDRQHYRIRSTLTPKSWMSFATSLNLSEEKNDDPEVNHRQHVRDADFMFSVTPNDRWSLDLGYGFANVFSTSRICFVSTPAPSNLPTCGAPFLEGNSQYNSDNHYGNIQFSLKPLRRVTLLGGYTISLTDGNQLILNPIQPNGSLDSVYHMPNAGILIDFARNWTGRFTFNNYQYSEAGGTGPTLGRDTRGEVYTFGIRYSLPGHGIR